MYKLTEQCKIPSRTYPAILDRFEELHNRYKRRLPIKILERTITGEQLLTAVLLNFFEMPEQERDRIVRENSEKFEWILMNEPEDLSEVPAFVAKAEVVFNGKTPLPIVAKRDETEAYLKREKERLTPKKVEPRSKETKSKK